MIPFVKDISFEYGACDQVSPLIRRVIARNPGPFTFTGTGTYIVGRGEVAVIDPGPEIDEHFDAILAAVAGERVTHIVITHNHSDHAPLALPLKARTGAPIYGCAVKGQVDADEGGGALADSHAAEVVPDVDLCGGGRIEGSGWTLEAIPTPGHTSNHLCFALLEENALFTGDHIMGWSTTVITPPDGDMGQYMESLARVRARNFETLWPTHGAPVRAVTPFIDAYIAHRRARETQIEQALAEGPAKILDLVPKLYVDVDKKLYPAAARSMLAHMIDLTRRGRLTTDGEPGPDNLYRLA